MLSYDTVYRLNETDDHVEAMYDYYIDEQLEKERIEAIEKFAVMARTIKIDDFQKLLCAAFNDGCMIAERLFKENDIDRSMVFAVEDDFYGYKAEFERTGRYEV